MNAPQAVFIELHRDVVGPVQGAELEEVDGFRLVLVHFATEGARALNRHPLRNERIGSRAKQPRSIQRDHAEEWAPRRLPHLGVNQAVPASRGDCSVLGNQISGVEVAVNGGHEVNESVHGART